MPPTPSDGRDIVKYLLCTKTRKRSYFTREQARKARAKTTASNGEDPSNMNIFECQHCNKWHIGHPPETKPITNDIETELKYLEHDRKTLNKLQKNVNHRMTTIAYTLHRDKLSHREIAKLLNTNTTHIDNLIRQHQHK